MQLPHLADWAAQKIIQSLITDIRGVLACEDASHDILQTLALVLPVVLLGKEVRHLQPGDLQARVKVKMLPCSLS